VGNFGGNFVSGMPGLSLAKISRRSARGQMQIGGKLERKMNGMDEKTK
jgi:hypothetical protein